MSLLFRSAALSLLLASLPLAAAPVATPLLHGQFLPADDLQLRSEVPEQQQLMLVTSYSVVVAASASPTNSRSRSLRPCWCA